MEVEGKGKDEAVFQVGDGGRIMGAGVYGEGRVKKIKDEVEEWEKSMGI